MSLLDRLVFENQREIHGEDMADFLDTPELLPRSTESEGSETDSLLFPPVLYDASDTLTDASSFSYSLVSSSDSDNDDSTTLSDLSDVYTDYYQKLPPGSLLSLSGIHLSTLEPSAIFVNFTPTTAKPRLSSIIPAVLPGQTIPLTPMTLSSQMLSPL